MSDLGLGTVPFVGVRLLGIMLGAALLYGAAHQQTRSGSWTQSDVSWETSSHFHGKHNVCWDGLFWGALLPLQVRRRLLFRRTDESGLVIAAGVRDRGQRRLRGQGRLWAQAPVLFVDRHGPRGGGAAGFVFGVVERDFGFLLRRGWGGAGTFFGDVVPWSGAAGQGWRATPLTFVRGVTGVHVALTAALCFTAGTRRGLKHLERQMESPQRSRHVRGSIRHVVVVVVDRAVFPGQHRVVVAPRARRGELGQNVLRLMEGHQTHTKQGEAEARNRSERLEMRRKPSLNLSFTPLEPQRN